MTHPIIYALIVTLCSALFMVLYRILVSQKADYTFCRRYIVVAMVLSAVIPMLDVPIMPAREKAQAVQTAAPVPAVSAPVQAQPMPQTDATEIVSIESFESSPISWTEILWIVYFIGLAVSLFLILRSIFIIGRLKEHSRLTEKDDYILAENRDVKSPFTFMRTVFMQPGNRNSEYRQILSHETSHVRHGHSLEKLFLSIIRSIFWFNPFMWLAEKRLDEVQEWQADNDALSEGYSVEEYRDTIIRQLFGMNPATASGLKNSFTKNRLMKMMQKENRNNRMSVAVASVCLTFALFLCFGCKERTGKEQSIEIMQTQSGQMGEREKFWKWIKKGSHAGFQVDCFFEDTALVDKRRLSKNLRTGKNFEKIEVYEHYGTGNPYPVTVAINGYQWADLPSSKKLNWVNENSRIFIGGKRSTYAEFMALERKDYIGIIYYNTKANQDVSFVYVVTELGSISAYDDYDIVINSEDLDIPDVTELPGLIGYRNTFVNFWCGERFNYRYVIFPDARYLIDGKEVTYKEYKEILDHHDGFNSNYVETIYRNSAAGQKIPGATSVIEATTR